jgi:hypothetical protein
MNSRLFGALAPLTLLAPLAACDLSEEPDASTASETPSVGNTPFLPDGDGSAATSNRVSLSRAFFKPDPTDIELADPEQAFEVFQSVAASGASFEQLLESVVGVAGRTDLADNLIVASAGNFVEYAGEALVHLRGQGGRLPVVLAQDGYDPILAPAGVLQLLPELATLGESLPPVARELLLSLEMPALPPALAPDAHLDLFKDRVPELPEVPAINRRVTGVTEEEGWTLPHVPALRWSADGRIGLNSQIGGGSCPPEQAQCPGRPNDVPLFLFAPERLQESFVESGRGPTALVMDSVGLSPAKLTSHLSDEDWVMMARGVPLSERDKGLRGSIHMATICDPFKRAPGERHNPYACGTGGTDDCYDLTIVGSYKPTGNIDGNGNPTPRLEWEERVVGADITVRVRNPKTPQARIAEVKYGRTRVGRGRSALIFEPLTPADGRLLVGRRGWNPLLWRHGRTNQLQFGLYDTVYAVSPPDASPCDVSHWSDFKPISHAPFDPEVNTRYDFARQPFRDPAGYPIKDGTDIKGTYPWIDKEAKTFSLQVSPANLFPYARYAYDDGRKYQSRHPTRCVSEVGGCSGSDQRRDSDTTKDNMFMLVGAWTQGKMVLLDGLLNPLDYRLSGASHGQSWLHLYQARTGHDPSDTGEVRVGSTRNGEQDYPVWHDDGSLLGRYNPRNFSVMDSMENRLNFLPQMKPRLFQDVVWNTSAGHHTVELSFDDYLNPDGFIVSDMVALFEHRSGNWFRMRHYDGWRNLLGDFEGQVRLQNSATAHPDRWLIPTHGRVHGGRMEPVANGGVRGKPSVSEKLSPLPSRVAAS